MKSVNKVHHVWLEVSMRARSVFMEKATVYGRSRFDEHSDEFDLWMCFSDVHRKTLRLEQMTRLAANGDDEALAKLISDYRDLINYSVMAVMKLTEERSDVSIDD